MDTIERIKSVFAISDIKEEKSLLERRIFNSKTMKREMLTALYNMRLYSMPYMRTEFVGVPMSIPTQSAIKLISDSVLLVSQEIEYMEERIKELEKEENSKGVAGND